MPIHHARNVYNGVNAHLHSLFQDEEDWEEFHAVFIVELAQYLNRVLPEEYVCSVERSLQLREVHPDGGVKLRFPRPDVMVYQRRRPKAAASASQIVPRSADLALPIAETFDADTEAFYNAVVIRELASESVRGRIVTRIELLSPSNKIGDGLREYRRKRYTALHTPTGLVEIDLLHETASPARGIPRYPDAPDSYPYSILVSDPYPSVAKGKTIVHRFSVDSPIPPFTVPLGGGTGMGVAIDPLYQEMFMTMRIYGLLVDYAQPPTRFNRYSPADRARIEAVMRRAAQEDADSS